MDDTTERTLGRTIIRREDHRVPVAARPSFEEVATEDYAETSVRLAAKLARKRPSPLLRGDGRIWAAGVVCAVGRLNWLTVPSQTPHLSTARLATLFGVKHATMATKAKLVLDLFGLDHFSTEFCLPSRLVSHPTAWLVLIDGLMHDARTLPVDLQAALAQQGVIPGVVVPADTPARTARQDGGR